MNQSQLSEVANQARVRLLQPAQGFYNELMEAWILFKTQNPGEKGEFAEYLQKVKSMQGARWNERYTGPTQFFFQTLLQEWKEINSKQSCCFEDEEQKTRQLCQNVREQL